MDKKMKREKMAIKWIKYGIAVLSLDEALNVTSINSNYTELTGYTLEHVLSGGHTWKQLVHPEDFQDLKEKMGKMLTNGEIFFCEHRIITKNQEIKKVLTEAEVWKERKDGLAIRCKILDKEEITKDEKLEQDSFSIDSQIKKYKTLADLTQDYIIEYDLSRKAMIFPKRNERECVILEQYLEQLEEEKMIHPDDIENYKNFWKKEEYGTDLMTCEFRSKRFSNTYQWYRANCAYIYGQDGKPVKIIGKLININAEKEEQQYLLKKSTLDSLTGLYNKAITKIMTDTYLRKEGIDGKHALILVDINNFREINLYVGKMFGDTVIENIADGLKKMFSIEDIIGRVGGDEFLIFMKNTNPEQVRKKSEEISRLIMQSYAGELQEAKISASIGIAQYPYDGKNYEQLFHNADIALYQVKMGKEKIYSFYNQNSENYLLADKISPPQEIEDSMKRKTGIYDLEIASFAFDLLADTKDMNSGIQLLLDRIGKRFGLSKILILENKGDKHLLFTDYYWNKEKGEKKEASAVYQYDKWHDFINRFDERGIICIDDCRTHSDYSIDLAYLHKLEAKSVITCGMYRDNQFRGCISFINCEKYQHWKGIVKETFLELTKIISYFIFTIQDKQSDAKKIQHLTDYDKVTGLYNLTKFKQEVKQILQKNDGTHQYAMLYSDINHFSYINEVFGYEKGDRLLYSFARQSAIDNPSCKIGCRIFSDFFVLLIEIKSKEEMLERIKRLNQQFESEQKEIYPNSDIHVVTGIYMITEKDSSISEIIDNANIARKAIKENRKAVCQIFKEEMKEKKNQEVIALATLKKAMENRELVVYLQPKYSLVTEKPVGAEALVRWINYDGSMKFPDEFIPALEQTGTIVDLDFYVYEQVLIIIRKWLDEGLTVLPVSVNLSRLHSHYDDFAERLLNLTLKYQIPSELIEFEITESAFVVEADKLISKLDMLRQAGFKMSIDDFGIGYSSLSMLCDAPADVVKMDKSFLKEGGKDEEKKGIIRLIIEMARIVHKEIVVEGVETREQADYLLTCGCTIVQGYFFAKPMAIQEFEERYFGEERYGN